MDRLDQFTQQKLDEILKKDLVALSQIDIEFLSARKTYLTAEQRQYYKTVFDRKFVEPKVSDPRKSRSYRALQAQAKELGLKYVGVGREELERSIDTAVGPR